MSGSQPTHEMGAFFAPCFMDRIEGERVLRVPLTEYIDSLAIPGVSYMIVNPTRTPAVWDQSNESLLVSGGGVPAHRRRREQELRGLPARLVCLTG
jgi:hypothetical protein